MIKEIGGGVCAPKGFRAGGIWCGIGSASRKRDLALIYSEKRCTAAGCFASDERSASALLSRRHVAGGKLRAIAANSLNANTGVDGEAAARRMADLAADEFALSAGEVAVASAGPAGGAFPIAAVESGISALSASLRSDEAGHEAALEAVTDHKKSGGAVEIELAGKPVRIGAMAAFSENADYKALLCFITTDAAIKAAELEKALNRSVEHSGFGAVLPGGMVIIMANGEAGNVLIEDEGTAYALFAETLENLCGGLLQAVK
jgi:glutamate N-acetyltransferase/amino-acid N-acetyltransferase